MEFIDLAAQQKRILKRINENIQKILAHGQYVMGPEIGELEERLADYVGVRHAVGCASGTDALLMALMALDVGPGDAVFTTPFTFVATAEVISLLGATPVFVDIDPDTFNIDPAQLALAIRAVRETDPTLHPLPTRNSLLRTGRPTLIPKCIIPVDLFGLPADYDAIGDIAQAGSLAVIEDAAQSFGAEVKGRKACSFGRMGCTSFFPAKPLGCYGDGGMCFTDEDALAEILRSLRVHGQGTDKYQNVRIGINGRLDTLQAAVLLPKFEIFPEEVLMRRNVAAAYTRLMAGNPRLRLPGVPADYQSVWAQYSLLAEDEAHRSALMAELKKAGVPTAIYYPRCLHLQTAFQNLGYGAGDFPVSEDCASRIFSLPMHPYIRLEEQERIASLIQGM